jgi:hypothetical protein
MPQPMGAANTPDNRRAALDVPLATAFRPISGLDSAVAAPIFGSMSASRELQRQLKRLELCLPRPAKKPPAGPGWIRCVHNNAHRGQFRANAHRSSSL